MSIKTRNDREEFEHNMHLVEENSLKKLQSNDEGAIQNFMWATWPHLKKVKRLLNGRINLLTINEIIRLQTNMENSDIWKRKI